MIAYRTATAEKMVTEIFGEYLFERDTRPAKPIVTNSCRLAIDPDYRSLFFKLVEPLGASNYASLQRWLFLDVNRLVINPERKKTIKKLFSDNVIEELSVHVPDWRGYNNQMYLPDIGKQAALVVVSQFGKDSRTGKDLASVEYSIGSALAYGFISTSELSIFVRDNTIVNPYQYRLFTNNPA